jgi:hypothetical protein
VGLEFTLASLVAHLLLRNGFASLFTQGVVVTCSGRSFASEKLRSSHSLQRSRGLKEGPELLALSSRL